MIWRLFPIIVLAAAACSARQEVRKSPSQARLALFPLNNHSTDLDGPRRVQRILHQAMTDAGWQLIAPESVEEGLKALHVSDPGQLRSVAIADIRSVVKADCFVFGDLLEYSMSSIGVLTKKTVEIRLNAVDPLSGQTLWQQTAIGANARAGTDAAAQLGIGLAGKVVSSVKEGVSNTMPDKFSKSKSVQKTSAAIDEATDWDLRDEARTAAATLAEGMGKQLPAKLNK